MSDMVKENMELEDTQKGKFLTFSIGAVEKQVKLQNISHAMLSMFKKGK